eukprot:CAMPEP_0204485666 /NCGR_PEP_ID=MMETSP0471-20130131/61749_1 /ASSEMBLY_ACC=CAM_ASM_000602 /TAXON_ID=2969 /ORGANISM="Oxyrrhis marina" /LENGTH=190 /DNA_ID=CAMNT_0051489197 /DNA_START=278 /DNA_END=847 /DNA_ORIENTATION=+
MTDSHSSSEPPDLRPKHGREYIATSGVLEDTQPAEIGQQRRRDQEQESQGCGDEDWHCSVVHVNTSDHNGEHKLEHCAVEDVGHHQDEQIVEEMASHTAMAAKYVTTNTKHENTRAPTAGARAHVNPSIDSNTEELFQHGQNHGLSSAARTATTLFTLSAGIIPLRTSHQVVNRLGKPARGPGGSSGAAG